MIVNTKSLEQQIASAMVNHNIAMKNGRQGSAEQAESRIDDYIDALRILGAPCETEMESNDCYTCLKVGEHRYMINDMENRLADSSRRQEILDEFLPVAQHFDDRLTDFTYNMDTNCVEVDRCGSHSFEISAGDSMGTMLTLLLSSILTPEH